LQASLLIYKLLALTVFSKIPLWGFVEPYVNISWCIILVPSYFIVGKALVGLIMKIIWFRAKKKKHHS
jgi:hypothetical protein